MEVLHRAETPDGVKIQVEDWRKDFYCIETLTIAAYPTARNRSASGWISAGERFRVEITRDWKDNEDVLEAFRQLATGETKLEDYKDRFQRPEHAGMI